jgi:nucleoid-associated protein YgaU
MATRTLQRDRPAGRGRGPGDVLAGLAAIAVLLALLAGVPVALVTAFGLPVPHNIPAPSVFTHQLQASAVLKACSVVVWLAWLQFVWCLAAEVTAAVRNTGMPRRVPLAGGTQALVHRLVAAALLLSAATTVAPALAPVAAVAATVPAQPAIAAGRVPGQAFPSAMAVAPVANGAATAPLALPGPEHAAPGDGRDRDWAQHTEKIYVVQPPVGRFHESLWEIAENHLGDGRRYREIFELNKGRPQPDGSKLTIASLIRPGWVLRMPHDAYGPGVEVVRVRPSGRHSASTSPVTPPSASSGPATPPSASSGPATPPHDHGHERLPAAGHTTAPITPVPQAVAPGTPGPAATPGPATSQRSTPAPAAPHSASPAYPLEFAAAGLLAAGVLAGLERRRRKQARRRPYRRQVVAPQPDAAWAELALRLGEDEAAAQMLDAGLRYLCYALERQGGPPTVFAVHVGEENLDLWVAPARHDAPVPWHAVGDGQVWRLALADAPRLELGQVTVPAPYPGLVSIGTDATGRVLVDIEAARGAIAVTGPAELVTDALSAMATELATSLWSDAMHITLVGGGEDLAVLAPERVHLAASLAEALPGLEAQAGEASGAPGERESPEACVPQYLVSLVPPAEAERERLLALARGGYSSGILVAGEMPGAAWTWEVTADGRLRAPQLGLEVAAQLIPYEQQAALAELFESAGELDGELMSAPPVDAAPAPHLLPDAVAPVEVTLLGPVSVRASGQVEPDRTALATELVVYLAAHPGGVHPNVLTAALWPRGVTDEVRDATLTRVQAWLGSDGIGRPHLAADASGRLRLGSDVRVDWHVFLSLVAQAERAPDGAWEEASLAQALNLVTGPFLAGTPRGRYAWIVTDGLEYEVAARVADAAHRLCELRLASEDPEGAMDAARAGLRLSPDDELLWRDLLTAAHATGQDHLLRAAAGEVWERASLDGPPPGMAPETEALMDELVPTWRWTVA